jgi:tRNA-specific 2-thiouridylase
VVDFVKQYWHSVFEPFLRDFDGGGSTPNPDLACNRHIKFGSLLHHCTAVLGADVLATGHYARVVEAEAKAVAGPGAEAEEAGAGEGEGRQPPPPPRLLRGVDPSKDQSYFLASVRGESLRRACFPLGGGD